MPPRIGPHTRAEECTAEDYNIPSEERKVLLEQLAEATGEVTLHCWAATHLCSLESLRTLVQIARNSPGVFRTATIDAVNLVKIRSQKFTSRSVASSVRATPRTSPAGPSTSTSPIESLDRSEAAKDAARLRDNYRCVLTRHHDIDTAHIFPHCLLQQEEELDGKRHRLWMMLQMFWPEEVITRWTSAIFPNTIEERGIETAVNLITLSKIAHSLWNKGLFALKPVSITDDQKTLVLQFFWQKTLKDTPALISPTTVPQSTEGLTADDYGLPMPYYPVDYVSTDLPVLHSGQYIEISTDDVNARPLPSIHLLEMQWFLQRVAGMAGAAEETGEVYDDDFSDGDAPDFMLNDPTIDTFSGSSSPQPPKPGSPLSPPSSVKPVCLYAI